MAKPCGWRQGSREAEAAERGHGLAFLGSLSSQSQCGCRGRAGSKPVAQGRTDSSLQNSDSCECLDHAVSLLIDLSGDFHCCRLHFFIVVELS